jgi:hypothetical protein
VGAMTMQTGRVDEANQPPLNYSVAVLQQKVFSRSNISAIVVNKQDFNYGDSTDSDFHYNRVFGLEYNLSTSDNVWNGKAYYQYSMDPDNPDSTFSYGSRLIYNKRNYTLTLAHQFVGNNYNAEVGYVPREGFQRFAPQLEVRFFPNSKVVNRHGFRVEAEYLWNSEAFKTDHKLELGYNISFLNNSFIFLNFNEEFTYLLDEFDPTRTDGEPLPANQGYTYRYFSMFFRSDQRKAFFVGSRGSAGQFFNGTKYTIGGDLSYRFQPYGNIGADIQYNYIKLPDPHNSAELVLIGPRVDVTFSKTVYLTGLFQYNNQVDNFNTNIRFQWRFKPVSDLYIVYTDNHYASDFSTKNRSLVLKLTYWLNL